MLYCAMASVTPGWGVHGCMPRRAVWVCGNRAVRSCTAAKAPNATLSPLTCWVTQMNDEQRALVVYAHSLETAAAGLRQQLALVSIDGIVNRHRLCTLGRAFRRWQRAPKAHLTANELGDSLTVDSLRVRGVGLAAELAQFLRAAHLLFTAPPLLRVVPLGHLGCHVGLSRGFVTWVCPGGARVCCTGEFTMESK
jgi:hypothetical protein